VRSEDIQSENQARISGCVDSDWKVHAEKTGYAELLRERDKCKMEDESHFGLVILHVHRGTFPEHRQLILFK
jgi:hypothetical protein